MNRLLSILVTLFILFLVYLWINHLTRGSDAVQDPDPVTEYQPSDEDDVETTMPLDESPATESDEHGDAMESNDAEEPSPSPEKPEPQTKAVEPKPATPPSPKVVKQTESEKKTSETAAPVAGMHLVIAGNFLTRANAEERVKQLQKLGYSQAEVVNFELSEYHTACAGRYKDLNEARRVSKKIKEQHGIDTYVRLGN